MFTRINAPDTVYHGTDSRFERFDLERCLGAHFGTRKAALDRLRARGQDRIYFQSYRCATGSWVVREMNWSNRPAFEHGPFPSSRAADQFCDSAPAQREPLAFEIDAYRPLVVPDLGTWTFEGVFLHLARNHRDVLAHALDSIWSHWNQSSIDGWNSLKAALREQGCDSVAYRNATEDPGSLSWIVFDHHRIHPAWQNSMNDEHEACQDRPRQRA